MSLRTWLALAMVFTACGPRITYVEPPTKVDLALAPGVATLTWQHGTNATTTLIARTLMNEEPTAPGAEIKVGDALGATGVVLALGEDLKLIDANLPGGCGPFSWHLWGRAADGTWSTTAATVRSLRGAHTIAPTAQITNLTSAFEGDKVRLQWDPPELSTAFELVKVFKKANSAPMSVNEGTLLYSGPSSSTTDLVRNLSSTPTYYAVFNCNSCENCGAMAPSVSVVSPTDGGVSLSITGLTTALSADKQSFELSWNTTAPRVKVLRTLNGPATSLTDANAVVVFDGAGAGTTERLDRLLPNLPLTARTYTYTAWACVGTLCSTTPATTTRAITLKQALQGGGYTLFFRHATAGTCADNLSLGNASVTTSPNWWKSCNAICGTATAEQLSPALSPAELAQVQTFFQTNAIPVSHVLSSEFCRAVRTAEGFAFGPQVEQVTALTKFVYDEPNRCLDAISLLNAPPAQGTNAVHVGHVEYPAACAVLDSLEPAEAAIYKPSFGAPPRFIARLTPLQWGLLP